MPNPERQHNALSALEVLFMAARAGIGFYNGRKDATTVVEPSLNAEESSVVQSSGVSALDKLLAAVTGSRA